MELHIGDLASLVDQGVGVDTKALHVAVVQGHTNIIHQKGELQPTQMTSVTWHLHIEEAEKLTTRGMIRMQERRQQRDRC